MAPVSPSCSPAQQTLSLEEASAALVAMLSGRPAGSIEEIRAVVGHLKARQRRSTSDLIADVKAIGLQLLAAMEGTDMVVAGPDQSRALAKSWDALCEEVWARPIQGPLDVVVHAYVALFTAQATDPARIASDIPFVKLCLAVIELEEVRHG